jgi:hypothetical protein
MPIRINLLAEAQADEELRRKDPVKRTLIGAVGVVALALCWCMVQQFKIITAKATLSSVSTQWEEIRTAYDEAVASRTKLMDAENKLDSLEMLRTNRFLWGNALDAVQRTLNGVDNIHMVRLSSEQVYDLDPGTPPRTNDTVVLPGKPATASEKISLSLEAIDSNEQPGSQVTKFKQSILGMSYFKDNLQQTNGVLLTSLSPPQSDGGGGKPFVKFTLQCFFPEKVR